MWDKFSEWMEKVGWVLILLVVVPLLIYEITIQLRLVEEVHDAVLEIRDAQREHYGEGGGPCHAFCTNVLNSVEIENVEPLATD